ncbi:UNVERIFIED_CONTAM: hypothetical protein PYX00_009673 [Menopon gallinae]|uniref:ubiquitinyl hydrolase 1 n=1 Tax=Menopon gallinae TaxID=328185 RepID=A0AAW2HCU3_9NEOP
MEPSVQRLQFLDLTDASENDQSLIERVLFSSNQTLEVPWFTGRLCVVENQAEPEWIPQQYNNIEGRPDLPGNQVPPHQGDVDAGGEQCGREEEQQDGEGQGNQDHHAQEQPPRQGGIFTGHPPTSLPHQQMYQMVPSLSNVYVSNVTANVNVHAPYVPPIPTHYGPQMPPPQQPQPQQVYSHPPPEGDQGNRVRRSRQQKDKKRDGPFIQTNEVMSPSMENHPPHQFPNIHAIPPYYIQGAAGAHLYTIPPQVVPVYPQIFGPYSASPSLVYPQASNMQPGTGEYHENVQQNFHPAAPEMVVVGGVMRQENSGERRGPEGADTNGYQMEGQIPENFQGEQRLQESFKPNSESNVHFNSEAESQADPIPALHQNGGEHLPHDGREEPNVIETVIIKNNCYDQKQELSNSQSGGVNQASTPKVEHNGQYSYPKENREQLGSQSDVVKLSRKKVREANEVEVNNDVNSVDNVCVNSHLSSTAGRISDETGGHCKVPPNDASKTKTNSSSNVQVMKMTIVQQESPVPISQNNEFPLIGQNAKSNRQSSDVSSSPDAKNVSSQNPPVMQTAPSAAKSWASLFNTSDQFNVSPASDNKIRPMARVPPYNDAENANSVAAGSPSAATTAAATKNERTSPKSNGTLAKKPVPNNNVINDPYLHMLGEFLCNYELDHRIVSLQPRGLTNRSNWCYINAIMQSLIVCPAFYNLLKALPVKMKRRGSSQTLIIDALVDFVNEFNLVPTNARIGKREKSARNKEDGSNSVEIAAGPAFEPSGIYKVLHKIRGENSFNIEGRQEDAEEFLSCLLNGLNDEMFELMKLVDSNKTVMANGDSNGALEGDAEDDDAEWNVMGPKNKSSVTRRAVCGQTPVSDIFRGQVRSRVQRAGDQSTDTVQPFFTLQLDVEKVNSVKDALELLVGRDPLEGVTCSRTHQEVEAWTQMSLEDLPLVLILHLKCFDYKSDGCTKIMKPVDFSIDLKVDTKLLSNRNKYQAKQKCYKLVAVVYHDGKEASKGHYVTDAYHVGYGCWVRYDDGVVRSVPESHVLKPRLPRVPYLLYYRRTDTIGTTK